MYCWLHISYDELHTVRDNYVYDSMAPERQYCTKWLEICFISLEATTIIQEKHKSQLHFKSVGIS